MNVSSGNEVVGGFMSLNNQLLYLTSVCIRFLKIDPHLLSSKVGVGAERHFTQSLGTLSVLIVWMGYLGLPPEYLDTCLSAG